jgi:hypothetical protein
VSFGDSGALELGGVDVPDSVLPDWAPPLLLMVTPGETWVVDDVVPDVVGVPVVAVVPVPVDVGPPLVDIGPFVVVDEGDVPVVDDVAVPVVDSPEVALDVELVADESEEVPVVSAAATPCPVATAVTSHAASAMPPYPPSFEARWHAPRDGDPVAGVLDEGAANSGLTGEWLPVMASPPLAVETRIDRPIKPMR